MIALFNKLLDWFKALFWKEEMELTLVGLQYSGKTTFVNVIAVRAGAAGRRAGLSPPAADPGRRLARPGAAGRRSRRLGPSTARGDLRARAPLSCPAGMARLGGGGGGLETRMVPGTGGPEGSRGRRDPVPAPTGPLRARRGGMTGRKCRACPPRVRSAIAARGLGGPAPGQPHPEALTLSRPKRKARAIEGEGRCPWHQRGRRGLALSASPPRGTAPRPRRRWPRRGSLQSLPLRSCRRRRWGPGTSCGGSARSGTLQPSRSWRVRAAQCQGRRRRS